MMMRWMAVGLAVVSGCGAYTPDCGTTFEPHGMGETNPAVGLSGQELLQAFEGERVDAMQQELTGEPLELSWTVQGVPGDATWWAPGATPGPRAGQAINLILVTCSEGLQAPATLDLSESTTGTRVRTTVELSTSTQTGASAMGLDGVLELRGSFPVKDLVTDVDWRSEMNDNWEIEETEGVVTLRLLDDVVIEALVGVQYTGRSPGSEVVNGSGIVRIVDGVPRDESSGDTGAQDTGPQDTAPVDTAPVDTSPVDTAPPDSGL